MIRTLARIGWAVLALACAAGAGAAQEPTQNGTALDVFLDCQTYFGCDTQHATREIPFVNWMRERQDADVHVLVTAQMTGGGGREITLSFIGLKEFAGEADTLQHVTSNTDTDAEARDAVTRLIKLGLTRFLAKTTAAPSLDLVYRPAVGQGAAAAATPADDPWNFWTFRVSAGGYFNGQSQQSDRRLNGSLSANRTTDAFKLVASLYGSTYRSAYTLSDSSEYVSTTESYTGNVLGVRSLNQHWSLGGMVRGNRSTYSNLDLSVAAGPVLEYNIFPYSQSTRAMVTLSYSVQAASFNYKDTTVTGKLAEILPRHQLGIGALVQQPWGQVQASVTGTQYLHDLSVHRIDSYASVTLRVIRGLEFTMFGDFYRIKDQFGLPAVGLTDEEILLSRRARETDYQYYVYFSLGYRFGSKFANVVNPRMSLIY